MKFLFCNNEYLNKILFKMDFEKEEYLTIDYYVNLFNINNNGKNFPDFIYSLYENFHFSYEEKIKVTNEVIIRYFEDNDYRNSLQEYYLTFIDFKFYGIYRKSEIRQLPFAGIKKLSILFSDNPPKYDMF